MKIKKIHLKDYLIFEKDLIIDLTYPIGHSDHGKPLKKICILGQSGLGKTTLLNLVKYFSFEDLINKYCIEQDFLKENSIEIEYHIEDHNHTFSKYKGNGEDLEYKDNHNNMGSGDLKRHINNDLLQNSKVQLISFPFDVLRSINNNNNGKGKEEKASTKSDITFLLSQSPDDKKTISQKKQEYLKRTVWDFSVDNIYWLWEIVLDEIEEYEREFTVKMKELLVDKVKEDESNLKECHDEFNQWKDSRHNPLTDIAKCLDHILGRFNLKVKTEIDLKNQDHKKFIRIQQASDGIEVPYSFLSTGTRQIMLTSLPLCKLKAENAIILFDEPERSLYPDVQIDLIKQYTELAKDSQFLFATHSPIVASAFEPWEIIELKFNPQTRKVGIEPYYEGERKIDNYRIFPQLLSYGDIYMDVFDLNYDGNAEFRTPEKIKLAELRKDFFKLKAEGADIITLKKKVEEITNAAERLGIDIRNFFLNNDSGEANKK
jgi:ABC-type lipoprotein export system ATPase subunit